MSTATVGGAASGPEEAVVSVIIVTWNSGPELDGCLASLAIEAQSVPLEVICVDNGSEDASVEVARRHGAVVVQSPGNVGFPAAVNRGLERATAPYVLVLNPDVTLDGTTVLACLDALRSDPTVGMVGCNLRLPDGRPDRASARRFRSLSAIAVEAFGLTRLSPRLDFQYFPRWRRDVSRDVPCVHGAFMLLRTPLLRSLGGLDESAFLYLEDSELCRRVGEAGLRVRFVAHVGGVHALSASTGRASPERRATAYLHRLDADLEFIRRTRGEPGRLVALVLLSIRAAAGLAHATLCRRADRTLKYRLAMSWLAHQRKGRIPPPPVR